MKHQKKRFLVFLYGTLKSGQPNHHFITSDPTAKLLMDDAYVQGTMYDMGPYPGIDPKSPGMSIGEVWDVSAHTLSRLDQYESHPTFYVRQEVPLLGCTATWQVWAYFLPRDRMPGCAVPMSVGNWPNKGIPYAQKWMPPL